MYASHRQRNVITYAHINKKYKCNQGQGRVSDSQVYCGHIKSSYGHPVILGQKVQMFPRLIKKFNVVWDINRILNETMSPAPFWAIL